MAKDNYPIANPTTNAIRSLHSFQFKKSVMDKLYKTYGQGFNTLDILRSLGRSESIANETMTAEEEGYDVRTITLGATTTVDSDDQFTFSLDADDLDSSGNWYPRVGFTIQFGTPITGFTQARITSITAPSTIVAYRYNSSAPTFTALDAAGVLATGTEVGIFDSAFAAETGQPAATSLGTWERTFYAQIFKETIGFGGMELAKQKWVSPDGVNMFNKEMSRAEFALDRQMEASLIMGQANDNSVTQVSSVDGSSTPVYKNKGIWTWIDELGSEVTYTAAGGWSFDDFDEMAAYFESQGVTESVIMVLGGGNLLRRIENSGVDYVQGTSGGLGTDNFFSSEGMIMSGSPDTYLNIGFRGVKKAGNLFLFRTLPIFTNPFQFGISDYMLNDAAIAIPLSKVKDAKSGLMIPNLMSKYVGIEGYSRERVAAPAAGMDGFLQQRMNAPMISSVDANNFYWLSHVMFPFMEANKGMIIRRSA